MDKCTMEGGLFRIGFIGIRGWTLGAGVGGLTGAGVGPKSKAEREGGERKWQREREERRKRGREK